MESDANFYVCAYLRIHGGKLLVLRFGMTRAEALAFIEAHQPFCFANLTELENPYG